MSKAVSKGKRVGTDGRGDGGRNRICKDDNQETYLSYGGLIVEKEGAERERFSCRVLGNSSFPC